MPDVRMAGPVRALGLALALLLIAWPVSATDVTAVRILNWEAVPCETGSPSPTEPGVYSTWWYNPTEGPIHVTGVFTWADGNSWAHTYIGDPWADTGWSVAGVGHPGTFGGTLLMPYRGALYIDSGCLAGRTSKSVYVWIYYTP